MTSPKVTVLMPVYNGVSYLSETIESILNQTFDDFEFLIIDDASVDGSQDVVRCYQDRRIRFFQNTVNIGQTRTLNKGIEISRGEYIARQDQDDISLPRRLEKQIAFMERFPAIGLLGSYIQIIDSSGISQVVIDAPLDDMEIRWRIMTRNTFAHPSVVIRREVLKRHQLRYDETFRIAQDYDLWSALLQYTQGANIAEPLVEYRIHRSSSTSKHLALMLDEHHRVVERSICRLLPEFEFPNDKLKQLVGLLILRPKFFSEIQKQRVSLAHLYLDMFFTFLKRYPFASSHRLLRQGIVLDVLYAIFYPPIPVDWLSVFQRLVVFGCEPLFRIILMVPMQLYRNWRFRHLRS